MTLSGVADAPASHLRAAMLATAMTLIATFPVFLLDHPPQLHRVTIDLREEIADAGAGRIYHRLDISADGRIALDGASREDLTELRMGLDLISLDP